MPDALPSAVPPTDRRNDLDAWWMPFTANRAFKRAPRMIAGAEGMHYLAEDGRRRPGSSVGARMARA